MSATLIRKARTVARVLRAGGLGGVTAVLSAKFATMVNRGRTSVRRARRRTLDFGVRPYFLRRRVEHVHGPLEVTYGANQVLLICVVRNGEFYIRSFVNHYDALGVSAYVFLDNGSTDRTVSMLREYNRFTILQTRAPYRRYENTMKRYLAERFSNGRWNLCVDIDELFDYPFSDRLAIADFLSYLNTFGYSAVVAQMLDFFSDEALTAVQSSPDDDLRIKYPYYDISNIQRTEYEWPAGAQPQIKMHWGGIRRVFGTNNGLTKAPLVYMNGRVKPFVEWHHTTGAKLADVSCVLKHYPFVSSFSAKVMEAVETARYGETTTAEYVAYGNALRRDPGLTLKTETARRYAGLEPLIASGFLSVSDRYRDWVAAHSIARVTGD